ncbi:hypothetical protein LI177_02720 [bacterium 210820-DFI.6.37]|nr:hypothetical protein [bacterium 210820-DFI.6.37]
MDEMDKFLTLNGASGISLKSEKGEIKMSVEFTGLPADKEEWLKTQIEEMYKEILHRLNLSSKA